MSQTNLSFRDIHFDSDEEVFFAMWLAELQDVGLVKHWIRNVLPIPLTTGLKVPYVKTTVLKTKTKIENKEAVILRPSEYTPDFAVLWSVDGFFYFINTPNSYHKEKLFFAPFWDKATLFEIKPSFDQNNMERLFINNQKFIWHIHKKFVNLVEPIELFKKTFMPALAMPYFKYVKSPTGKNKGKKFKGDWKMDWIPKTITQYNKQISYGPVNHEQKSV